MERIMKAQALTNAQTDAMSGTKNRFFELNPNHHLVQSLRNMHTGDDNGDDNGDGDGDGDGDGNGGDECQTRETDE